MDKIINECQVVCNDLIQQANLNKGDIVVIGCSTSTVLGSKWGTDSNVDLGKVLFDAIYQVFSSKGIYIAAQCCEHLNRALVVEREAANKDDIVNVVPQPKAGGSFATAAYKGMKDAVVVENIKADAGLDIGLTLIGMHLKKVAVPVKLKLPKIGEAIISAARTRPKFIGGIRAVYDENMM